ncbi:hypothetical protein ACFE04_012760 [Oxalis oulophora]
MERRSWPWKKKSSDKTEKSANQPVESAVAETQADQESYKKPSYVQISVESYSHLTGLEEQVKNYEEQVQIFEDEIKDLNEKLSTAQAEIIAKEILVKQHNKVAEEAVSGWEKAEAEALALKNHLETVTLSKLTVEDRASHLDGALKECMRQIRNLKEENEQKLQELALTKNKQIDKLRHELEARISNLDQELLHSAAENAALSRSLQDRSNMLLRISEEKSQAEGEIEHLRGTIESCEREINSLKYELHISSKELEIRNEEKNMSVKSADVANKQHMEGMKKIAKLEAECQRLRGLVRKKLPGPAALAQMKHEVDNWGRDNGDKIRRSPSKPSSPHLPPVTEFAMDSVQKFHKENEFLTERLLAMEEETKMLKEALAKRNTELQASRNLCAKTVSKLQNLEAQMQLKSSPKSAEGFLSQNGSHPPSVTSVSEDDASSYTESTGLISEKSNKASNTKHLELMDDFLEMEKLAFLSNHADANNEISDSNKKISETKNIETPGEVTCAQSLQSEQNGDLSSVNHESGADQEPLLNLQAKISMAFESTSKDADISKLLEKINQLVQETHGSLQQETQHCDTDGADLSTGTEKEIVVSQNNEKPAVFVQSVNPDLVSAISQIHDFVLFLGKETMQVHDMSPNELNQKIEEFSTTFSKFIDGNLDLVHFVCDLSRVLTKASELMINVLGYKGVETELSSTDCIDKVALPGERYHPEVPDDGSLVPGYESSKGCSCKFSLEDFEELKTEKNNMSMDLAACTENLGATKLQLQETEQLLADIKSELASAQKSNCLAETQLKCMAESYRSLEKRTQELKTELNVLQAKTETLESELEGEKRNHDDALARCKELEEQLIRHDTESAIEIDDKTKQEREIASAAEKLAECQETIFLLGKQLKAMHPQSEMTIGSPLNDREPQKAERFFYEPEPTTSDFEPELDTATSTNGGRVGSESPIYNNPTYQASDSETNIMRSPKQQPRHRPTKSSSSTSSTPTPEKQARGFSRFFSSKGKNGQ